MRTIIVLRGPAYWAKKLVGFRRAVYIVPRSEYGSRGVIHIGLSLTYFRSDILHTCKRSNKACNPKVEQIQLITVSLSH